MKFKDYFKTFKRNSQSQNYIDPENVGTEIKGQQVKVLEVGTSGTENYAGYLEEEYLKDLRGDEAADVYDKMRRSDPKVKMLLSAMKNPIKGARWSIDVLEESREAKIQKAIFEEILFSGLDKSWVSKLSEILTMLDFGYSLFELTYKPVIAHPKLGSYVGLSKLAYRSQKTIERWNIDDKGKLLSVSQYAYGDSGKLVNIPSKYLVRFALEDEGDNFEGISVLRPCYGPWLRKNEYLKYMVAGAEKFAIPTPMATVPNGKYNTNEYKRLKKVLEDYISHRKNYLIKPQGWDIEIESSKFEPDKLKTAIELENNEMVNAVLANFLQLGQGGFGSYALSMDLSDFFLGAIEFYAMHVCEVINTQVLDKLTALNFGDQDRLVELKAHGIRDKAGKEFAEIVKMLVDGNIIQADDRLEENIRERYKLSKKDESSEREAPEKNPLMLAEGKKKPKRQPETQAKIRSASERYQKLFEEQLSKLKDNAIADVMKTYRVSKPSDRPKAARIKTIRGIREYKSKLTDLMATIHNESITQVRNQYPMFKNVKLSETERNIRLAEIDKLNTQQKNRIKTQADVLAETQENDIKKAIQLSFLSAIEQTSDELQIEGQINERVSGKIANDLTKTAALAQATKVVNAARADFFFQKEVRKEIESYTLINADPVSAICTELNGRTISVDSPLIKTYQPPLHFNCDSFWVANMKGGRNNPLITKNADLITKKAQKSINLAEIKESDRIPPKAGIESAKKVLRWRDEHEVDAMTETGWRRASQIASGKPLSIETIKKIAQFERHKENAKIDPKFKGEPWKDKGHVAYEGWGGQATIDWAQRLLEKLDE